MQIGIWHDPIDQPGSDGSERSISVRVLPTKYYLKGIIEYGVGKGYAQYENAQAHPPI